jgi:sulfur carrier protein
MVIRINGKVENIEKVSNIAELVSGRGLSPEKIVVEHNLKILPMEQWAVTGVRENDNIEIVSFVQGG